jgi:type VI secretion system secreted protein Hcp
MYIKIGDIKGEAQDKKHKDEIDVLAWSWGMSQSGTTHMGHGGGGGKVNIQDLSFTKYVDKSTPTLMQFCCGGTHIAKTVLTVRKAGGKAPIEYIIITLEEAIISSLSTGGSGGEDRLTENVTLNFGKFKLEYVPQGPSGVAEAAIPVTYDIAANSGE